MTNLEHKLKEAEDCIYQARLLLSEILKEDFITTELEDHRCAFDSEYYIEGVVGKDISYRHMTYGNSFVCEIEYAPLDDLIALAEKYITHVNNKES